MHSKSNTVRSLTSRTQTRNRIGVKPELVIEAKFNEWTKSGKLREPTYIGLRTDVNQKTVRREHIAGMEAQPTTVEARDGHRDRGVRDHPVESQETQALLAQINAIAEHGGRGTLTFQNGLALAVDDLQKPVWRRLGITKADLMRYYIKMSPYLLPTIADRIEGRHSSGGFYDANAR